MRIVEILNEYEDNDEYSPNTISTDHDEVKKIADFVRENCGEWLSQTKDGRHFVYRGFSNMRRYDATAFRKKLRQDRKPLDSGDARHDMMNFLIKYGNKSANRTNSMFVVGSAAKARVYGKAFITIPIGAFNYTWHQDYHDWSFAMIPHELLRKKITGKKQGKIGSYIDNKLAVASIRKSRNQWTVGEDPLETLDPEPITGWLKGLHGDDGTLIEAIKSKNEIMIAADEVIAINPVLYKAVLQQLKSAK